MTGPAVSPGQGAVQPVRPRRVVGITLGCIALTIGVAWLDIESGIQARVFPLYYLPIAWAAVRVSRGMGVAFALLSTAFWVSAMVLGEAPWSVATFLFNTVTQAVSFLIIALLVGTLVERVEAERQLSRHDSLTHLPNHRSFIELGDLLFAAARRNKTPITLAYVDLDNFKQVNDKQGHAEGDRALVEAAKALRTTGRRSDVAARLGGDEFALLLPDTDGPHAVLALERLSKELVAAMQKRKWPITASIGAITFEAAPESVREAINRADELMYRVKKHGKNQVLVEVQRSARKANEEG